MKEWFEKWFSNKLYLDVYKDRDEQDARMFINLIQRNTNLTAGKKVLDVCCGQGRHSIEFGRRGYNVLGIDISEILIERARSALKRECERELKVRFEIEDMRTFSYKNSFDAAVNIFSSFGYFDNDIENFVVFDNIRSSLKKKGLFVFDFLNATYLKKNIISESKNKIGGKTIIQQRQITSDYVVKYIYIDKIKNKPDFFERIKLYSFEEFRKQFEFHGFKICKVFGDYCGNKYIKDKSGRIIIFAEKQ